MREEVPVVVDEDGDGEAVLEHGAQGHSASERGEVVGVADDSRRVVRGTREGEADGGGSRGLLAHPPESLHERGQAGRAVVSVGGEPQGGRHLPRALHGREDEVGAARVQGQDHPRVVLEGGPHREPLFRPEGAPRRRRAMATAPRQGSPT